MAEPRRLTLFDCIAIGINGIIGSGIFLLPGWVAKGGKALSPLAFVACGALCALVALCYAEASGMFDRSGGTYLYAREAFGEEIGFSVGWIVLVSCIFGYATIARGFGEEVIRGAGLVLHRDVSLLVGHYAAIPAAVLILFLGVANWLGIKAGARTSDALTIIKVVALVLFVVGGLFFVRRTNLTDLGTPDARGFAEGMFSALFALSGFEFVAVVAGQTENPRRSIPLSIVGSLLGAVVLYALIQLVVVGVLPGVTDAKAPMVEAASVFGDGPAAGAVRIAALLSMVGFCSGSALVGPQLVASLARDRVLPAAFGNHYLKRGTPELSLLLVTLGSVAAVAMLQFKELADLTIITLFAQYVPTCLAVLVFRYRRPDAPRLFRMPLGPAIPFAALAVMMLLIVRIEAKALLTTAIILSAGIAIRLAMYLFRALAGSPKPGTGT